MGILASSPPIMLDPVLRLASVMQYATYSEANKQLLKDNASLRNVAQGKTAFVLATGPSVCELDISRIVGQDCFTVSNFFLHPLINELRPKMHFFAPYHKPLIYKEFVSWLQQADQSLPKQTDITLGIDTKHSVEESKVFEGRTTRYLGLEKSEMKSNFDLRYPVPRPHSIPLMVLPVLLFMGYKRIVLVGCDHNILKDYGNTVSNFYNESADPRSNATSGENWSSGIVHHLKNALNVFLRYQKYQKYCEKSGIELIHTSPEGWLDFIPYVPLDKISLTK